MDNPLNDMEKKIKILQGKIEKCKTDEDKKKLALDMDNLHDEIDSLKDEELTMHWWECAAYTVGEVFPPAYALLGFGLFSEHKKGKTIKEFVTDRFKTIGKMMAVVKE